MLGEEEVCLAALLAALVMIIHSAPSVVATVRASARMVAKYRLLRSIDSFDGAKVPDEVVEQWNVARSSMGYSAIVTDEIAKLDALRPTMLQAEASGVLLAALMAYPGFEGGALWMAAAALAADAAAVLYGSLGTRMCLKAYVKLLEELNSNGDESAGSMYGRGWKPLSTGSGWTVA